MIINKQTRVIVQGISGKQGTAHSKIMRKYGTNIVAGVVPGKGGQYINNIPVYDHVVDALKHHPADFSIIFVPAKRAKDACLEALYNGLNIVVITEHMLVHDVLEIERVAIRNKLMLIGPNCPGIIAVGECKIGIMPDYIFKKGEIGIISRSGTLTYEIVHELSKKNIGQSTCIGIGGDPLIGMTFIDALALFESDPKTKKIVMIGEIGGDLEEKAAEYIQKHMTKKVVAYIAGRTAPKGKTMGHAGAVIMGNAGTVEYKTKILERCGIKVARLPSDVVKLVKR